MNGWNQIMMKHHFNNFKNIIMHIRFANINFKCPYCNKKYIDDKDVYLTKINANKSFYTRVKCDCCNKFGVTQNMKADLVAFKLDEPNNFLTKN